MSRQPHPSAQTDDKSAAAGDIDALTATHMLKDLLLDRSRRDWEEDARYLVSQGADLRRLGNRVFGRNMLHVVAERGSLDAIGFVVDHGLDVNKQTIGGKTALHVLMERINTLGQGPHEIQDVQEILDAMQALLDRGANPELTTREDARLQLEPMSALRHYTRNWNGRFLFPIYALLDAGVYLDEASHKRIDDLEEEMELSSDWSQRYWSRWEAAQQFADYPDISQLTPDIVCALGNLGRLGALGNIALWQGHEPELQQLLMDVPPFLSEKILALSPQLIKLLEPQTSVQAPAIHQQIAAHKNETSR